MDTKKKTDKQKEKKDRHTRRKETDIQKEK